MSKNNVRILSRNNAQALIQFWESLARRYQEAFLLQSFDAKALGDQLTREIHDDRNNEESLTPAASLAWHLLKDAGNWPDTTTMARDAANRAISEFVRNPMQWKTHEKFGSYMRRALDWRAKDCLREEYPHLELRVENEGRTDDEGFSSSFTASQPDTRHGCEQDADDVLARVQKIIGAMPARRRIIATERLLKSDGQSGKELARRFEMCEGWVAGELEKARETIRQQYEMCA
ncbi:MAG: hypothetical protein ACKO26_18285 [Planctomycetota bacterium]